MLVVILGLAVYSIQFIYQVYSEVNLRKTERENKIGKSLWGMEKVTGSVVPTLPIFHMPWPCQTSQINHGILFCRI